jgi:hypothetical protein
MASKTNITLALDKDLLREAKVMAAQQNTSVSQLLADQLRRVVESGKQYEKAKKRALKLLREGLDLNWTPHTSRDELHER